MLGRYRLLTIKLKEILMLDERYKNALKGLKAQAEAVTSSFPNNPDRAALTQAQRLMSDNDLETKKIYQLIMKNGVSVVDLTEKQLEQWLDNN